MKIAIFESYYGGSHKSWIHGLQKYSKHEIKVFSLPDRYWKWRLHGGGISLAKKVSTKDEAPDLIITTSMTDVTLLKSFLPENWKGIPIHLYFHENQFAYKWSSKDKDYKTEREDHYYFVQYVSALAADKVFFNSNYNLETFLIGIKDLLKNMPDFQNLETIKDIQKKSSVVPLGLDWDFIDQIKSISKDNKEPIIVWNHRWEEDKNPNDFFKILGELKKRSFNFKLMVLGDGKSHHMDFWLKQKEQFKNEIIHWGKVTSYLDYLNMLKSADISIVTSHHDFFGLSVLESVYCEVLTLLPNRLAYPEHFSKKNFQEISYNNESELLAKILSYRKFNTNKYKEDIMRYRIQDIIDLYEKTIFSC